MCFIASMGAHELLALFQAGDSNAVVTWLQDQTAEGLKEAVSVTDPSNGNNALAYCCIFDDVASAQALLECADIDVNQRNDNGQSCLHHAAVNGAVSGVIKLLLRDHRCYQMTPDSSQWLRELVDCVNKWNETPVHVAAAAGRHAMVAELINAGARTGISPCSDCGVPAVVMPR